MELREDIVDIIVSFYPSEEGYRRLEKMKKSLEAIDAGFPYRLIVAEGKKPCVENRNDGLKQSNSLYVILMDDDVEFIEPFWLKKAIDKIKLDSRIGAVGFRIVDKNNKLTNAGRRIFKEDYANISKDRIKIELEKTEENCEVDLVAGCCVLYNRLVAGYFPEAIYNVGRASCDDNDYQLTIKGNGFKIFYLGKVSIKHNTENYDFKKKLYGLDEDEYKCHEIFSRRWKLISE